MDNELGEPAAGSQDASAVSIVLGPDGKPYVDQNGNVYDDLVAHVGDYFATKQYWLHVKNRGTSYLGYAEYYFEAWVTSGAADDSPRVPVDLLEITWRHGGTHGHEAKENADMIGKPDRIYGLNIGVDSMCVLAVATLNGVRWSASSPPGCAIAG